MNRMQVVSDFGDGLWGVRACQNAAKLFAVQKMTVIWGVMSRIHDYIIIGEKRALDDVSRSAGK